MGEGGRRGAGGGGLDHRRTKVGGTRLDDRPPLPPPNDDKASARAETPSTFFKETDKKGLTHPEPISIIRLLLAN